MEFIVIFVLTLINGFFALAEISLVSVKKTKIDQLAANGNAKARTVQELLKKPESFLSAVQVGITLIGVISGAYGGMTLTDDLMVILRPMNFLGEYLYIVSLVIVVGGITFFTIVIGELAPKTIAINYSLKLALFVAPIIKYFSIIVFPFIKILSISTKLILKIIGIKQVQNENMSEEELKFILLSAGKQGVLETEESQAHQNLFYFTDQTAVSLMTDRTSVEWVDINSSTEDISKLLTNSIHSKFIVCDGSMNNILGIITAKSFFENYLNENFKLSSILQKPIFIKANTKSFKILEQFKRKKQYLAIVKDDTENFIGIITIHDLIEAIVGRLPEYDEELSPNIIKREDDTYLINGKTTIFDLNHYFKKEIIKSSDPKHTSLEEYILTSLSEAPRTGAILKLESSSFEILDMDGSKLDKILFKENNEKE